MSKLTLEEWCGAFWGKHRIYNLRETMMYKVCRTILIKYGPDHPFYFATTSKEFHEPFAFGHSLADFEPLLDRVRMHFWVTTPVKYRIYLATWMCHTYGEFVRAGLECASVIKGENLYDILEFFKFPREAFEKFLKKNRPQKTILYQGKAYELKKILKYVHDYNDLFNLRFYRTRNLIHEVDIDEIPDMDYNGELAIDTQTMFNMTQLVAERFGVNKTIYIAYLDKGLGHPIGMGLFREDMTFYHRRIKGIYVRKSTPLKFSYYYHKWQFSDMHFSANPYLRIQVLVFMYKFYKKLQNERDFPRKIVLPKNIDYYLTIDHPSSRKWNGYPNRDIFIEQFAEVTGIGEEIWNAEFYQNNNLIQPITISHIRFSQNLGIED